MFTKFKNMGFTTLKVAPLANTEKVGKVAKVALVVTAATLATKCLRQLTHMRGRYSRWGLARSA
jgi:hypothetical protein